jgi:hypothetical protein
MFLQPPLGSHCFVEILPSLRSAGEARNDPIAERLEIRFGLDEELLVGIV